MKRMRDVPLQDRPREKLAGRGAEVLSDQELIEAILGRGTRERDVREIARDVTVRLREQDGRIRYEELVGIEGIGPSRAAQIAACFELGRRQYSPPSGTRKITCPEDVLPLVGDLRGKRQEHFVCITLNGAGEVIASRTVTIGLLNHSLVHPREVFADAITDRAASVICIHNHPSGTLEASPQDIAITRQLQEAGHLLGITLLDHLIVTKAGFVSLKEQGHL